jgi:uncharacterized protein (DUF1697 family)
MKKREVHVALIRGINVGRAKRIGMADLRKVVEGLGYTGVQTLLNSGNVVFASDGRSSSDAASRIEKAMSAKLGVSARVFVYSARDIERVIDENPLPAAAREPSRLLVAFVEKPAELKRLDDVAKRDWSPDSLAITSRAAYLWCPNGMSSGELATTVMKALGSAGTTRNWSTVNKLHTMAEAALAR